MTHSLDHQQGFDYVKEKETGGEYYSRGIGCYQNKSKESKGRRLKRVYNMK
jgi:hypothetical protein